MTAAVMDETLISASLPCHLIDPDVFFAEAPAEIEFAKTLCSDCPVRRECLDGALSRRETCGVWGGQLIVNGEVVAHKRPRGRPRKNPVPIVPTAPGELGSAVRRPSQARPGDRRSGQAA